MSDLSKNLENLVNDMNCLLEDINDYIKSENIIKKFI